MTVNMDTYTKQHQDAHDLPSLQQPFFPQAAQE